MSATFAAFGCHRKTHRRPVIHAFLGDVDSGAEDKNSWTVNLKVTELIIIKYKNHNKYYLKYHSQRILLRSAPYIVRTLELVEGRQAWSL